MALKAQVLKAVESPLAPWALFGIALVLRIAFLAAHPPAEFIFSDMERYDTTAQQLLAGVRNPWQAFHPVGFSACLGLLFKLSGSRALVGPVLALCGASLAPLSWRLGGQLGLSGQNSFWAGLLVAVNLPLIHYGGFGLTEVPAAVAMLAALTLCFGSTLSLGRALAVGALMGLMVVVRPNLVLVEMIALAACWKQPPAKLALAISLIPILAASAYNTAVVGKPTGPSANSGVNLYLNFAPVKKLVYDVGGDLHWVSPNPNNVHYSAIEQTEIPFYDDAAYYKRTASLLLAQPFQAVVALRNLQEALGLGQQGYWPEVPAFQSFEPRWNRLFNLLLTLPAGLLFFRCFRHSTRPVQSAFGVLVIGALSAFLFLGDPRLRVPFDPVVTVLGILAWQTYLARGSAALREAERTGPEAA